MKKHKAIVVAALALFIAALVMSLEAYRFKRIEKNGPAEVSPVAADLSADARTVSAAVQNTFNVWDDLARTNFSGSYRNKFPAGNRWSQFYLFRRGGSALDPFPPDEEILLDRGKDEFVRRYVAISPGLRRDDFYLYEPSGDEYWPSEYTYRRHPAKFRCSFFIHMEPASGSQTRVEVFEYQPEVWAGEKFGMSAHAILPGMLHDIRFAQPTTSERVEVLNMIRDAVPVEQKK